MIWRIGIITIVLGTALGGCSPKRVTSSGVVTSPTLERRASGTTEAPRTTVPASRPGSPAESPLAMPEPEPLSRSGAATVPTARSTPTALGTRAVELARAQLGKPYQWGAAGPDKFDCSGLVQYVYSNLGVPLPRVSGQQAGQGVHIDRQDLRPGDLVFFRLSGNRIDHVGIYVGQGRFIHAPRKHNPVRLDSLNNSWWRRKFKGGRRVG